MVELDKKNIEQKLFSSDFKFEDSSIFKELMNLYPWCSSFTVVYLKSLSLTNDMRFPNELEEYAIQLNSREVIYNLMRELNSDETSSEIKIKDEEMDDQPQVHNLEATAEKKKESSEPELAKNSNDVELEKLIVSKIISDNLINEISEEDQSVNEENSRADNIEPQVERITESKESVFDDSPKSFNAWLIQGEEFNKEKSNKEYLTFEKPKKDFFSPQSTAKESLGVKNLPVSETLAKVFESQGNYSMAISTYEQLILIFPEKKISFANQIGKIKNKII